MQHKAKILFQYPWAGGDMEGDGYIISPKFTLEEADALLVEWKPNENLWTFPRRKVWFCCEPPFQIKVQDSGSWLEYVKKLPPHEFIRHNHPDPQFRVPHATHYGQLQFCEDETARDKFAVAIVSNFGNTPRLRPRDFYYRNRLITHDEVDLFGRSWHLYRKNYFTRRGAPANYQGPLPGDWGDAAKRQMLRQYHACVCLENQFQPHYFTEKFVEAATAGCIPIYRAHPTVRETVLQGAQWIDPQNYGNNPAKTLAAARAADRVMIQRANNEWMRTSEAFQATHTSAIYSRLAEILLEQ